MRHLEQLTLTAPWIAHEHASELATISELLDAQPRLAALVQQDLLAACPHNPRTGRAGLTGDQVLRMLLARQLNGWTYAELAFHLADSGSYRTFCRVGGFGPAPSKSALAANLRRVRPQTLDTLNALVVTGDAARAVETGRVVRIDSTVVPVAIHPPTDSSLLLDGVRVLLRLLREAERRTGFTAYHRHLKRVKRRALEIQHLAPQATGPRRAAYRELLALTQATADYASYALAHVEALPPTRALRRLHRKLAQMLPRVAHAIAQATRRVLHGELVPAPEKLVSLFETHTDVIVKDRRDTYYGHKIFLTGGASGLILDCAIPKGNPADSTWTVPMLVRQGTLYGCPPRQASFDGGFASADNLAAAKALPVKDVCFSKKRGLAVLDMVTSSWVYRKLRDFRAGIESGISLLKRVFGLARCVWKGAVGFHAYVRAAVLTANLLTLARHRLA